MQGDFCVGDWTIRPKLRSIESAGQSIQVRPKAMAVLECLAAAAGDPVSRDELFEQVWPNVVVSDDTLTQNIVELRKAFGDSARAAQVIETIPKLGFRLVPAVSAIATPDVPPVEVTTPKPANRLIRWILVSPVIAAFGFLVYLATVETERPVIRIEQAQSLAILPFTDMSQKQDQHYVGDGLVEELQVNLARLRGLRVTGRTSTAYFKGKNTQLREIGDRLQVEHVLEGSVRESGDRLRVSAKLVNVKNGYQVWSNSYDLGQGDLFEVQEEIAKSVATALSITLSVGELGAINGGTRNLEAYQTYLNGWSVYLEGSTESHKKALQIFRRATELDPNYALAWERIAHLNIRLPINADASLRENWKEESGRALDRAMAAAPNSPSVLATAAVRHSFLHEWKEAELLYQGAGDLSNEGLAPPLFNFANYLSPAGRTPEAIELYEKAKEIEPLSGIIAITLGSAYSSMKRYKDAEVQFEQAFNLSPGRGVTPIIAGANALAAGDPELLAKWQSRERQFPAPWSAMYEPIEDLNANDPNDRLQATKWLESVLAVREANSAGDPIDGSLAWTANLYGAPELALTFFNRFPDEQAIWLPHYSAMRQLPGFKQVVRDLGLVDYWREFGWGEFCQPIADDDFECH